MRKATSHRSGWEGIGEYGSPALLGVSVMGSKGCLERRQLPLCSHVAQSRGGTHIMIYVLCICQLELCDTVMLGGGS